MSEVNLADLKIATEDAISLFGRPFQSGMPETSAGYSNLEAAAEALPQGHPLKDAALAFRHSASVVLALKHEDGYTTEMVSATSAMSDLGHALLDLLG